MKLLEFRLVSGRRASFYLTTNFVVVTNSNGCVSILDGVHNNGGWDLHESHTYEEVIDAIKAYN